MRSSNCECLQDANLQFRKTDQNKTSKVTVKAQKQIVNKKADKNNEENKDSRIRDKKNANGRNGFVF